jgi:hypothetical protein
MAVTIEPMRLADVLHVCENMRQVDWVEVLNLLPRSVDTPEQIAMTAMAVSRFGLVAKVDGVPAIVLQFSEVLDGTFRAGLFGTDQFPKAIRVMYREIMLNVMPYLIEEMGAVYCEAYSDTLHPEAHRMLNHMGFAKVAILPEYGSRGRDIALYVLTKEQANVFWRGRRVRTASTSADTGRLGGDHGAEQLPETARE